MSAYSAIVRQVLDFKDDRNWSQFHTLKDLSAALTIEAAELQELLLWHDNDKIDENLSDPEFRVSLKDECADIFNYLILICDRAGFDILDAARCKITKNNLKYPVDKSYGVSTKYNKLDK